MKQKLFWIVSLFSCLIPFSASVKASDGLACGVQRTQIRGGRRGFADPSRCYEFEVLPDIALMQLSFESLSNSYFNLYREEGEIDFFKEWHRINTRLIEPEEGEVNYVIPNPSRGIHTIGLTTTEDGVSRGEYRISVLAGEDIDSDVYTSTSSEDSQGRAYKIGTATESIIRLGSDFGDRIIFPIEIARPGRVEVEARWQGDAEELSLILNGPQQVGYYDREDGSSPLRLVYDVTAADLNKGRRWQLSVVNFNGGEAEIDLDLNYPNSPGLNFTDYRASIDEFVGTWINRDSQTRDITKLEIRLLDDSLGVRSFGSCQPQDCDHGEEIVAFQGNPIVVSREFSFKDVVQNLVMLDEGDLLLISDNVFTDGTNRDYVSRAQFRRVSSDQPQSLETETSRQEETVRLDREDCITFNPNNLVAGQANGRWKIIENGNHWMFDFENRRDEAEQSLRIIQRYAMDASCFVGRPMPSFQYMLTDRNSPSGSITGEDCISFNLNNIEVVEINNRWKIVDGNHWMFDFEDNESEARQSFAIIKKYGFTHSCYVGRPDPDFRYLRR